MTQERIVEIDRLPLGDAVHVYPGDAVDIEAVTVTEELRGSDGDLAPGDGRLAVLRRSGGTLLGFLRENLDPELYGAQVADPTRMTIRLQPFTVEPCGCVFNLGGYLVRQCPQAAERDEAWPLPHVTLAGEDDDAKSLTEDEQAGRDDRRAIDEAVS